MSPLHSDLAWQTISWASDLPDFRPGRHCAGTRFFEVSLICCRTWRLQRLAAYYAIPPWAELSRSVCGAFPHSTWRLSCSPSLGQRSLHLQVFALSALSAAKAANTFCYCWPGPHDHADVGFGYDSLLCFDIFSHSIIPSESTRPCTHILKLSTIKVTTTVKASQTTMSSAGFAT